MTNKKDKVVKVRLTDDMHARVTERAAGTGKLSVAELVRDLISREVLTGPSMRVEVGKPVSSQGPTGTAKEVSANGPVPSNQGSGPAGDRPAPAGFTRVAFIIPSPAHEYLTDRDINVVDVCKDAIKARFTAEKAME